MHSSSLRLTSRGIFYTVLAIGLYALDQVLKYLARAHPDERWYLIDRWLGWEHFANDGIAFGIFFPQQLLIIITPILLILLLAGWEQSVEKKKKVAPLEITLFLTGALSNFTDRILFGITTDYLRIATLIVNLADIFILCAVLLIIWRWHHGAQHDHLCTPPSMQGPSSDSSAKRSR